MIRFGLTLKLFEKSNKEFFSRLTFKTEEEDNMKRGRYLKVG